MHTTDIRTVDNTVRAMPEEDGKLKIKGTALVFDEPSQDMGFIEYIKPDAVRDLDFSNTMLLYSHDSSKILARSNANNLNINVTDRGVDFEAVLANTTLAKDVYEDIRSGNLQGCSFGFKIADDGDEWDTRDDGTIVHTINKIDHISELSVTPIPAYLETSVGVQRSLDKMKEEIHLDKKDDEIRSLKEEVDSLKKENKELKDKKTSEDDKTPKNETKVKEDSTKEEVSDKPESGKEDLPAPSKEEKRDLKTMVKINKTNITPEANASDKEIRSFADYLKNGSRTDTRDVTGGIGLPAGQVIIPKTILTPEHKVYQFPRLGSLVRTVNVKTTTGMLPLFELVDDKLAEHAEFAETTPGSAPQIKEIDWKLQTYTGRYVFSQELINDSTYDWQSELSDCLRQLRDNTDDSLIMDALVSSPAHKQTKVTDVIGELKTALNVNLMPNDSAQSTIVLSQSAFNYIDKMNDKIGRPLVNTNLTEGMGKQLLGHQMIVVADTLFPSAKVGDVNIVVAPLQKAVINFKQSEITGQFQDTYDVWYKQLGIFLRENVVAARPDLVTLIQADSSVTAETTGVAK